MKAIIFGANGQDGFYLSALLRDKNIEVLEVSRSGNMLMLDITDYEVIKQFVNRHQPDYIFHLAANSTTRHDASFENHATISTGTLNLLEAVKKVSPATKVFISGSGLQFKNENKPIKETDAFEARDAYSVSRIHSVYAARYYRSLGIKTYVGYFFNHDSPRRSERHMAKKIAEAAKRISNGSDEQLLIGDIAVIKEWTYAGDIVEGVWALVQQDAVFEANIASGLGYSIEDWVRLCFKLIGKDWTSYVQVQSSFKAEYRQLVADPSLILSLGFKPKVSFDQLAQMMLFS
ncbi:MAG: GDP-mannose 4,6-dehydratase [Chitinophagaceae bacterium]